MKRKFGSSGILVFFLYGAGDHPDLHSFPTRRSSDLCRCSWSAGTTSTVGRPIDALSSAGERSEEHTSELQSRRDLVCRLLLEKKKNNRQTQAGHADEALTLITNANIQATAHAPRSVR